MGGSNFTNMERFYDLLLKLGLTYQYMTKNGERGEIRIFKDGARVMDYFPLRGKCRVNNQWIQLEHFYDGFGLINDLEIELKKIIESP